MGAISTGASNDIEQAAKLALETITGEEFMQILNG